jgi:hypothetical protein
VVTDKDALYRIPLFKEDIYFITLSYFGFNKLFNHVIRHTALKFL